MTDDKYQEPQEEPEKPKAFLYLAALMILVAVVAYVFQGSLFDLTGSESAFIFALVLPVLLALFFVYCYRTPSFGRKVMGHSAPLVDKPGKTQGLSYNIFKGESGAEEKLAHTRRKSARHLRKQLARETAKLDDENAP